MDIKENKKSETKQTLLLVLGIFLISMFIIGGTYAYMTLSITFNNNTISYSTTCFDIVYDADNDSTPITGTLIPSSGPGGGLNGKISLGLSASCKNIDAYGTFNLDVTSGSDILFQTVDAHCENSQTLRTLTKYTDSTSCEASANGKWVTGGTALKYAVYTTNNITSTTVPIKTGYIKSNGIIPIYKNFPVLNETVNYYFYVWLDGNLTDNTYASQSFVGGISASASQAAAVSPEPNAPVLDAGMIPVKIANNGTVTTVASDDSSWYNYGNKEWANAVLVKESGTQTRNYYKSNVGVTIAEDDILAYYVWIPRYKYKIPQIKCSEINSPTIETYPDCYGAPYIMSDTVKASAVAWWKQYMTGGVGSEYQEGQAIIDINTLLNNGIAYIDVVGRDITFDMFKSMYDRNNDVPLVYTETFNINNLLSGPRTIDIVFESKNTVISSGDATNTYYTHPAFIWDGNTISGMWVGKFETSVDTSSTCYTSASSTNCNNGNQEPRILPNVNSLTWQNVSNQFITSLKFAGGTLSNGNVTFAGNNTYGLISTTDSHMMKNSEWGAVAYLSHSQYGINSEVRLNNNSNYTTGCGASEENGSYATECQIVYGSGITEYPQSTTGNISGIFDMSGGAHEYVMGVYSDSAGNPMSGYSTDDSGFNGLVEYGTEYTSGVDFPQSKYYDLYLRSHFTGDSKTNMLLCTLETCGGHALYETAGWNGDYHSFIGVYSPWFIRGGLYSLDSRAGVFSVNSYYSEMTGSEERSNSWRSVLVVD